MDPIIAVISPEQHKEMLTQWVEQYNKENDADVDPEEVWAKVLEGLVDNGCSDY